MLVRVTAGAGYIGSHAAKASAADFHPAELDDLSREHSRAVKWGSIYLHRHGRQLVSPSDQGPRQRAAAGPI